MKQLVYMERHQAADFWKVTWKVASACYSMMPGVTCFVFSKTCYDELFAEPLLTCRTSTVSALSCFEGHGDEVSLNAASQQRNAKRYTSWLEAQE